MAAAARLARAGRRRAGDCISASPTRRANGTPADAIRASSTAARGSPRRSTERRARDRAQRARARLPGGQPARERTRGRGARRANRRLRALLAAVAALLVLAALRRRAVARPARRGPRRGAHRRGRSGSAPRRSSRTTSTARCCWRARAWRIEDSLQTRSNLLAALLRSPAAIGVVRSRSNRLSELALRPDGRALVVGDNHGIVLFLDPSAPALRRRPTAALGVPTFRGGVAIRDLAFSRDGSRLAIGSAGTGRTCSTAAPGGRSRRPGPRRRVQTRARRYLRRTCALRGIGRTLQVPYAQTPAGSRPPAAALRRPHRPAARRSGSARGRRLAGRRLAFSRRRPLVTPRRERDSTSPRRENPGDSAPFATRTAAAAAQFPRLALRGRPLPGRADVRVRRPRRLGPLPRSRTGSRRTAAGDTRVAVQRAAFTADGRFLVTAGDDGNAIVWDVRPARRPRRSRATPAASRAGGRPPGAHALTPRASTAASSRGTSPATGASAVRSTPEPASGDISLRPRSAPTAARSHRAGRRRGQPRRLRDACPRADPSRAGASRATRRRSGRAERSSSAA